MCVRHLARFALYCLVVLPVATVTLAEETPFERRAPAREPHRRPMTRAEILQIELEPPASTQVEHIAVGEASATDAQGDLNVYYVDGPVLTLSGEIVGATVPGSLVSGGSFDPNQTNFQGYCYAGTTGYSNQDLFGWQKGVTVAGGDPVAYSLSGSTDVTWSVGHSTHVNPSFRKHAYIGCERLDASFNDYEEAYQFTTEHVGQGRWRPYYFWIGPGPTSNPFANGVFDDFELPLADITSVSAIQSGGSLEISVTVAGAIPAASSTPRSKFILYAKPTAQQLSKYMTIEARDGAWKGVLFDYTGVPWVGSEVRSDLPVTVSGNIATIRVDTTDLLLSGSTLSVIVQGYTEQLISGQLYEGRADIASVSVQLSEVTLGRLPEAMVQAAGTAGASTEFSLVNNGASSATVTLGISGSFFTLGSTSVTIPAGEASVVTITGNAVPAGEYNGSVTLSGTGIAAGTSLPVQLLSAAPPSQTPLPRGPIRSDKAEPPSVTSYEASIEFSNPGAGTVTGVLSSNVPWIVPQSAFVSIAPGATQSLFYTIDRTKRLYGNQPGSSSGTLSLSYLNPTATAKRPFDSSGTSLAGVVVVDTVKPPTSATPLGPLGAGEIALFFAGVQGGPPAQGRVTDINIFPSSATSIPELTMFFVPEGAGSTQAASFTNVGSAVSISLANAVTTVFDQEVNGTFVLRGNGSLSGLQVSGTHLNISSSSGSFGTTIPVLRSDRGARAGESLRMTGVVGGAGTVWTDIVLQEVAGLPANVTAEFLNAAGTSVGTAQQRSLAAFAGFRWVNAVPAGAVTAIISVDAGSEGKVSGYAAPYNLVSGDHSVTSDWPRLLGYAPNSVVVIPVGGSITGINGTRFGTELSLFNPGDTPVTARLTFHSDIASGAPTTADVTIDPKQTKSYADVFQELFKISGRALGYIRIDPKGSALLSSSRTWSTKGTGSAIYGMGVPAMPLSRGIKRNGLKRIPAIEDSSPEVFLAKLPATYRTNLGLLETGGAAATVQVTLNYEYAKSGSLAAAMASKSKTYELAPNSFRLLWSLTQELLGDLRSTLDSSIRSMSIEVKVTAGAGTVETFATAVENASGDQQFKME